MATWVASGMDDVTGPSATRLPSWKRTIERKDGTTETQELQYTNAGNDPMEPLHVAIQTESNQPTEVQEISLTAASLALITEALAEGEKTKRFFDRLLPFHSRDSARLQLNRTVPVTAMPSEALQVRFMAVGANGRIALLLAAEQHESWCNHNSHVVVCHWNKQFVLPQAVCPTAAAWGQQGILAVGTYAGNVDLYHGQQLMASTQAK